MMKNDHDSTSINEASPLLPVDDPDRVGGKRGGPTTTGLGAARSDRPSSSSSSVAKGRWILVLVAVLYGSLSVSLRMVYARPGPPEASVLSATRGWMTVLCLLPVAVARRRGRTTAASPTASPTQRGSRASFTGYALELAVYNAGTQGLLNTGLKTTESARSAFFTQLSVVLTPVLAAAIGRCCRRVQRRSTGIAVPPRVWAACLLALAGLCVLSSSSSSSNEDGDSGATGRSGGGDHDDDEGMPIFDDDYDDDDDDGNSLGWGLLHLLSFGDWCCLGSAFAWSLYIYRLSDWGHRYDETRTMFVKNVFVAILYTCWTVASYYRAATDGDGGGFRLWEGWRDPVSLSIVLYSAVSSGALADVLQQAGQARVPAAESGVILSLEPVVAALLGLLVLRELPSPLEIAGGSLVVAASVLARGGGGGTAT